MYEIVFIMGKSASGKDNIYKKVVNDTQLNLKTVTLYTTRPMRNGENNGVEYFFVDNLRALQMENDNKIIEMRTYNTIYGEWKYFTADDGQIDLSCGQRYIVLGTLEAYEKFCSYFGKEHILPIYIEVDDGIRLRRALEREERQKSPKYEEMCRRFLADARDFSEENIRKAGIKKRFSNNNDINECVKNIKEEIISKWKPGSEK